MSNEENNDNHDNNQNQNQNHGRLRGLRGLGSNLSLSNRLRYKQWVVIVGIGIVAGALIFVFAPSNDKDTNHKHSNVNSRDVKIVNGALRGTALDNTFLDVNDNEQAKQDKALQTEKQKRQTEIDLLKQELEAMKTQAQADNERMSNEESELRNSLQSLEDTTNYLSKQLDNTSKQLGIAQQKAATAPNYANGTRNGNGYQNGINGTVKKVNPLITKISLTNITPKQHDIKYYLPVGSYAKATIISGVDAAVGVQSQGDPRPILFRITNKAISADYQHTHNKFDVRGCTVTGAAYGDLSSERVYVRLQKMTCSRHHKKVFEFATEGYMVGQGKAGVRGKVISRVGGKLAKAGIAGFISGVGEGIANMFSNTGSGNGVTVNTGSGNQTQAKIPMADILKVGAGKGAGNASEMLAQYYMKRAELMNPIISLKSDKAVELVFLKGVDLKPYLKGL